MADIGFIGVGNMGRPMAANLVKAGHAVTVFDPVADAARAAEAAGCRRAADVAEAARGRAIVLTMLPSGAEVREVYLGEGGVLTAARPGDLLVDCSTIDVATAREVSEAAARAGMAMLDAPVSGGVRGAAAATLTFMVGGEAEAVARAEPILLAMGKTVVHAGGSGNGQAAKICNNMILGASMIVVAEAFALADRLGLERQKLYDIASKSSGQCWALTVNCPAPGPVPAAPSSNGFRPGFTAAMMLKDLRLAQAAALATGTPTPIGAEAAALYGLLCAAGHGGLDFSAVFLMVSGEEA
jgi:3-hydroxyisobutyrate dehydrogenase